MHRAAVIRHVAHARAPPERPLARQCRDVGPPSTSLNDAADATR